jgi:thioredoxin 1
VADASAGRLEFDMQEGTLSENTIELTSENFDAEVLQSDVPVLVDFWAVWCAPCRMIAPVVEELAETYSGTVKVGKLNVDENGDIAFRYNVRGIPALLMFGDGQVRDQMVGAGSRDRIVTMIEKASAAPA